MLCHTLRPRRQDKVHHLDAARFLRRQAREGDLLLTDSSHVLRNAGVEGHLLGGTSLSKPVRFLGFIHGKAVTLVAVRARETREKRPAIAALFAEPGFTELRAFATRDLAGKPNPIHVYRVDPVKAKALFLEERRRSRQRATRPRP